MKLTTLQENLKSGLFTVSHIAGKNINLPILSNIMIEAREGNIKLITTDLELGVVSKVRGKIEAEGSITVDAKLFSDYISLLPNQKIEIEKTDSKISIKCENYKTTIKGQESEEFPLIPQVDKKEHYTIKTEEFKKSLSQVVFAVSTSETRVELSGVLFNFQKDKLILAATDSYRLAEKKINIKTNSNEEKRIIVPAKTLQEVIRILSGIKESELNEGGEMKFYISDNQILFEMGSTELVSRLIEGQYPDYTQIIPQNHKTTASINRGEFVRAVKASSIFSKTGINDVNLDFPIGKNQTVVSSASGQTGENITELTSNVSGGENSIVVNFRYLLDGINNINSENIKIELTDGNTPCILRGEKEDDYLYIIMPIKQ